MYLYCRVKCITDASVSTMHCFLSCISTHLPTNASFFVVFVSFEVSRPLCCKSLSPGCVGACPSHAAGAHSVKLKRTENQAKVRSGPGPVLSRTRSGSPFYCRVCCPGYCPPRARWRKTALEEPDERQTESN